MIVKLFTYLKSIIIQPLVSNQIKMSAFSRDISAPFQDLSAATSSTSVVDEEFEREFASIKYSFGKINIYDKQEFTPIKYQGPSPESNWVIQGKLLVGAFPGYVNDKENAELIKVLSKNNPRVFVIIFPFNDLPLYKNYALSFEENHKRNIELKCW